jgi:molybdate transport system permease protein
VNLAPLLLSFQIALLAVFLAALVAVPLAAVMARTRFFGSGLLDALLVAPMALPPTVLGYYLLVWLGRRSVVGQLYESLVGSPIVFTRTGAVVAAFVAAFPFVLRSCRAAFEEVDVRLLGAARTLGAGPIKIFFTIEMPLGWSGVVAGLTLGFARALGDFGVTLMVAGNIPGHTQTGALAIFEAVEAGRTPQAEGLSLVMTAIALSSLWVVGRLTRSHRHGF